MLDLSSLIAGPKLAEFSSNSDAESLLSSPSDKNWDLEDREDRDRTREQATDEPSFVLLLSGGIQAIPEQTKALSLEVQSTKGGFPEGTSEPISGLSPLFVTQNRSATSIIPSFGSSQPAFAGISILPLDLAAMASREITGTGAGPGMGSAQSPNSILTQNANKHPLDFDAASVIPTSKAEIATSSSASSHPDAVNVNAVSTGEPLGESAVQAADRLPPITEDAVLAAVNSNKPLFEPIRTLARHDEVRHDARSSSVAEESRLLSVRPGIISPHFGNSEDGTGDSNEMAVRPAVASPNELRFEEMQGDSKKIGRYRSLNSESKQDQQRTLWRDQRVATQAAPPAELTHLAEHTVNDAIVPQRFGQSPLATLTYRVDDVNKNDSIDPFAEAPIETKATPSELNLQLDSPDLGTVWVSVKETQGGIFASIETSSSAAYDQVMQQLHALREMIQEAGIALGSLELGWRSGDESQGRRHSMETMANHVEYALQEKDMAPARSKWLVNDAGDTYQVNVFA